MICSYSIAFGNIEKREMGHQLVELWLYMFVRCSLQHYDGWVNQVYNGDSSLKCVLWAVSPHRPFSRPACSPWEIKSKTIHGHGHVDTAGCTASESETLRTQDERKLLRRL